MSKEKKENKQKEDKKKKLPTSHDSFFKEAMKQPPVHREFFEEYTPPHILAKLDIDSIQPAKTHFIDEELKNSYADCLFTARMGRKPVYLYLLVEHQRKPYRFMAFRMQKYMHAIWDQHLVKHPKAKKLPLILPFLFYNGDTPYPHSLSFRDIINAPNDWVDQIESEGAKLIDLPAIPDQELRKRVHLGVMTLSMKHIYDDMQPFEMLMIQLKKVPNEERSGRLWRVMVKYYFEARDDVDQHEVVRLTRKHLSEKEAEVVMTTADRLRKEGRVEGKKEGRIEGLKEAALNLLKSGLDPQFVASNTKLPLSAINELEAKL
jgi:predicted transposase/invertase (TIGR01784 family)